MPIEIRELGPGDENLLMTAPPREVFDCDVDPIAARDFLAAPRNHIVVAIDGGAVVGMVSAVHNTHPDKPRPDLWINEVGVAGSHQRRGVGREMMRAMLDVGRRLGCGQAWVLTHRSNTAAMGLYDSLGLHAEREEAVMFSFVLDDAGNAGAAGDE